MASYHRYLLKALSKRINTVPFKTFTFNDELADMLNSLRGLTPCGISPSRIDGLSDCIFCMYT